MSRKIYIYDTTLRDGAQGEGINFSSADKIRIAERLDAFGINYIEGGWPGSNPKDMDFFAEAAKRKFKQEVFVAEFYLDRLYQHGLREVHFEALPRFPAVERDFSFVFADAVRFDQIRQAVAGLRLGELRGFVPAEIFRGGAVPAGKYSLLLRATFQSNQRTLKEDEVAHWTAQIVDVLEALGGTLRKS